MRIAKQDLQDDASGLPRIEAFSRVLNQGFLQTDKRFMLLAVHKMDSKGSESLATAQTQHTQQPQTRSILTVFCE